MPAGVGIPIISSNTTDHHKSADERNAKILNVKNHLNDQKIQISIQRKRNNTSEEPLQMPDEIKDYEMRFYN